MVDPLPRGGHRAATAWGGRGRCAAPAVVLLAAALAGCASSAPTPQQTADKITRAVYQNDLDATLGTFDDQTKRAITRAELGEISDRMHQLGDYQSLAPKRADPDSGRYEYDARFSSGVLLVQMRLDPSGRVGAYRVVPETASDTPSPAAG